MRFRLRIADLMVLVALVAASAAAYRLSPTLLPNLAFALYLAALCLASLGAKFRRGDRPMKMFWKGYALFGWFYLVLGLYFGVGRMGDELLAHSILGLGIAFVCGYVTRRVVTRTMPAAVTKAAVGGTATAEGGL